MNKKQVQRGLHLFFYLERYSLLRIGHCKEYKAGF